MENEIEILSVNISEHPETVKKPVPFIKLSVSGIHNDSHTGSPYRQVKMMDIESYPDFEEENKPVSYGEFAENITVRNLKLFKSAIAIFDRFYNRNIDLEVTGIGKNHGAKIEAKHVRSHNSLQSDSGIFLRVIKGGELKTGDRLTYKPKEFKIRIITVSDRASKGIYEDRSGPEIVALTEQFFKRIGRLSKTDIEILPDDPEQIRQTVQNAVDQQADIIFTTGGTGIGPRDFTPDVIRKMLEKEIPGIMEMIRVKYGMEIPNALLSRGIAGIIGTSLVYTLPGSVKAVREYCEEIFKTIYHSLLMLYGIGDH